MHGWHLAFSHWQKRCSYALAFLCLWTVVCALTCYQFSFSLTLRVRDPALTKPHVDLSYPGPALAVGLVPDPEQTVIGTDESALKMLSHTQDFRQTATLTSWSGNAPELPWVVRAAHYNHSLTWHPDTSWGQSGRSTFGFPNDCHRFRRWNVFYFAKKYWVSRTSPLY